MDTRLNIIVVEDNDDLREAFVEALSGNGHTACGIDCAEALDDTLGRFNADILILDLNLASEDGLSVARRMRAAKPDIGIIMVTARNQMSDITSGYKSGADIYLTKPTTFEALAAALTALSRRVQPPLGSTDGFVLNQAARQLYGPLGSVDLSALEYTLLAAFAQAHEHRLENWQLMELSSKDAEVISKSALEVQIVRLRRKLESAGASAPTIKAIRGIGYQLCTPVEIRRDKPV